MIIEFNLYIQKYITVIIKPKKTKFTLKVLILAKLVFTNYLIKHKKNG